jgi:hypothetical protein
MVGKAPTSQTKSSRKELPLWGSILLLISAIVACSIGGVFMRKFWHERQAGKESLNWPQTEGVVTRCEYHQRRRDAHARISYQYDVGGKAYSSVQVDVAKDYLLIEPKAFVDKHPTGTKIPVYYNVDHPEVSVLLPGIDSENTAVLVLFGTMLLFLCVTTLYGVFQITLRIFAP